MHHQREITPIFLCAIKERQLQFKSFSVALKERQLQLKSFSVPYQCTVKGKKLQLKLFNITFSKMAWCHSVTYLYHNTRNTSYFYFVVWQLRDRLSVFHSSMQLLKKFAKSKNIVVLYLHYWPRWRFVPCCVAVVAGSACKRLQDLCSWRWR